MTPMPLPATWPAKFLLREIATVRVLAHVAIVCVCVCVYIYIYISIFFYDLYTYI